MAVWAIGDIQGCRFELRGRFGLHPRRVTPLDLAAAIGQFLGDHPVPAGPAVVKGVGLSDRIRGPPTGYVKAGKMFVPASPGAVFAGAHAWRPRGARQLEFTAPAA